MSRDLEFVIAPVAYCIRKVVLVYSLIGVFGFKSRS